MDFATEAELQARVGALIRAGGLKGAVHGIDEIRPLVVYSDDVLPIFSLDHLARRSMLEAAVGCFSSLHELNILTDDQNVSQITGEVLRPDFVGLSVEDEAIWIIELKNSGQTAREALTELLGYEHEVKNHLPFLADWDVNFIIISTEWSALLDHGLASACAWSGKKIVGLLAALSSPGRACHV